MAWFYEIRSSDDAVLKRNDGFADQEAAKIAGREEAKNIKASRRIGGPTVARVVVGHKAESGGRTQKSL